MSIVISIANQKGGVGKTTTCLEIAQCLAEKGKKVIVIDFDMQGNASDNLGASHEPNIVSVFRQSVTLDKAIQHTGAFDLISSTEELSLLDVEFSTQKDRDNIYILTDVCEALKERYDYILIDNTPARNTALSMAYIASDYVLCPTEADENSFKGIINIAKDIKALRHTRNKDSHAFIRGIIITKYETTTKLHNGALELASTIARNLEKEMAEDGVEKDVFIETVRKSVKVGEVKSVKGTLQEYDRYCTAAMDYRRIAEKILKL